MCSWTAAALLYIFLTCLSDSALCLTCVRDLRVISQKCWHVLVHTAVVFTAADWHAAQQQCFWVSRWKQKRTLVLAQYWKMLPSPDSTLLPVPLPPPPSFHPRGSDHVLIRGTLLIYILLPSTLDSIENLWAITEHSGDHCSDIEWIKQFLGSALTTRPLFDWVWRGSFNFFLIEKFSM